MSLGFATNAKRREGDRLSSQLSVAQVLANLEAQMAAHREGVAHHAERESFHREQREAHAAELETIGRHYEAFKASAAAAAEIAARAGAPAPPPPREPEAAPSVKLQPGKLVTRVVEEIPEGETFGASYIVKEVNRRFRDQQRKPLGSPQASTSLRRLLAEGHLRLVQKGTAHREAIYTRILPSKGENP
jgi:hypothetical protein